GAGQGQHLVDLELGWQFCHRDLQAHFSTTRSPLLGGINRTGFRDHGTKVLGIICGRPPQSIVESSAPCCIGITPCLASVGVISYATGAAAAAEGCVGAPPVSGPIARNDALMQATSHLQALGGGVLLLEVEVGSTEAGVWGTWAKSEHPIEIIPTDLEQIRLARDLGIVVVEAAGNDGADLDQYEDMLGKHSLRVRIPDPSNPSLTIPNLDFQDSGAIMVGASLQNLHRKSSSNYGSRVNCFAWGQGVFSTNLNGTYTSLFNGTSSASAIIAGVALSVLGLIAANKLPARTPQQIRELLSDKIYGRLSTPSSRPIGSMPDLAKIIKDALGLN
ncbi:MAG TPA: S8 family serine peptidase, partial [Blastocatellia bacterium]|nr:S8 family serine peptidase [Blastocatellia bacterium]